MIETLSHPFNLDSNQDSGVNVLFCEGPVKGKVKDAHGFMLFLCLRLGYEKISIVKLE